MAHYLPLMPPPGRSSPSIDTSRRTSTTPMPQLHNNSTTSPSRVVQTRHYVRNKTRSIILVHDQIKCDIKPSSRPITPSKAIPFHKSNEYAEIKLVREKVLPNRTQKRRHSKSKTTSLPHVQAELTSSNQYFRPKTPSAPKISRLPTPDLPDLDTTDFCGCCGKTTTRDLKHDQLVKVNESEY
jgi:hypothetical protein